MTKTTMWMSWVVVTIAIVIGGNSFAMGGNFVVSGDSNIINGLDGSAGAPTPNDNGVFFNNVLQGGSVVKIYAGTIGLVGSLSDAPDIVNTYYNAQAGVTSSIGSGPITSAALSGVNLLVDILPDNAMTSSELSAMSGFLNAGGSVFFLGENSNSLFTPGNTSINADLAALGSSLSIVPNGLDSGFHTATVGNGQIVANPLTSGVNSFVYAFVSEVTGGQPLFLTTDMTPFVAVQVAATVPEPSSLLLAAFPAVLGLRYVWRRARVRPGNPQPPTR
jgi:hypothetical protein